MLLLYDCHASVETVVNYLLWALGLFERFWNSYLLLQKDKQVPSHSVFRIPLKPSLSLSGAQMSTEPT